MERRRQYPRTARVQELLREVIAEELERIDDDRLAFIAVTGVDVDREIRTAKVYLSSLEPEAATALAQHRMRLQGAIGRQARLRRTPELRFAADSGVAAGARVEEIIRELHNGEGES
jgi:ribosome-binding factor A